jgi:AcrR family transcriptional regulator
MLTTPRGRPPGFDRDDLLDRAVRLFWESGYQATSVRDLTDGLGISAPSLYNAFGGKQQLFAEVVRLYDATYGGFIEAALVEEATASRAAARIFDEAPARYTRRGLPTGCLVASGAVGAPDPEVRKAVHSVRQHNVRLLADKIRRDVGKGVLPAHTDADSLARYTLAVLSGMAQDARDGLSRAKLTKLASIARAAWPAPVAHDVTEDTGDNPVVGA